MPLVVASTAALSVSVSFNYYMQRLITFRSAAKHYIAGPKFFFIAGCTLATNAAIFSVLITAVPYFISQILTLLIIFPLNYNLNRVITFR